MANVLLIRTERQSALETGDCISPPLGLLCLAAYARKQRPGKDRFTLLHEGVRGKGKSDWTDIIGALQPDCIAISSLTVEIRRLAVLVPRLKRTFPEIPLLLGGPCASAAGPELLRRLPVDFLVEGEGEEAFLQLLEMVERKRAEPEGEVSGLAYLNPAGEIVHWPRNQNLVDVEKLPIPAWDLIELRDYQNLPRLTPFGRNRPYAPLVTSRGCPYRCVFCHDIFPKRFRALPTARVVDEIETLIETYGIHEFEIQDDIFNFDRARVLDICKEIKARKLSTAFTFPNGVRSDILDREVLEALVSVGTMHVSFAVESASPRIQKLARKDLRLDKVRENIAIAKDLGLLCWGFFMLGFPTESRLEMWKSVLWAWSSPLHGAFFFRVIPHPGTALAREYGSQAPDDLSGSGSAYFDAKGSMARIGPFELWLTHSLAYVIFLMAPRRLWALHRHMSKGTGGFAHYACRFLRYILWQKPKHLLERARATVSSRLGRGKLSGGTMPSARPLDEE